MLIQCTNKLLDQLGIKAVPAMEEDPLFSWHAHLITLNRRKTVVLMNDQNRYVVVLYGLKAKDFGNLEQLIEKGIREAFREECISEEVIEKYFQNAKGAAFAKTKNRPFVAKLNNACNDVQNVYFHNSFFDGHSHPGPALGSRVSRAPVKGTDQKYTQPNEAMYKDLEVFAGKPIFRTKAAVLKVTLLLEKHNVWRRLSVPVNKTFKDLHRVLQTAFGWKDSHLHEFYLYHDESDFPSVNMVCDKEAFDYADDLSSKGIEMKLEDGVKLSDYIPSFKKLQYVYDFGDYWQHQIEVENIIEEVERNFPACLEGEGNAPPEDVGGDYGYEEFLEILADPDHPEHGDTAAWGRMQGYHEFNMEQVNRMLKYI